MYPKTEHDPALLKKLRQEHARGKKLTQAELAKEINAVFEACGVPDGVIQKQVADWESGKCQLGLTRGLAVAGILGTTFSELIHQEILRLGPLESRLLEFPSIPEANHFLWQAESEGRVALFAGFPSPLFITLALPQRDWPPERLATARRRFTQLSRPHAHSQEFYPLDKLLEFAFSPFSPLCAPEKVAVLDKVKELFTSQYNRLHFFSGSSYQSMTANLLFSRARRAVYVYLSCHLMTMLEIRNVWLYERLLGLLQDCYQNTPSNFTTTEESLVFINKIIMLVGSEGGGGGTPLRQSGRFMRNVRLNCNRCCARRSGIYCRRLVSWIIQGTPRPSAMLRHTRHKAISRNKDTLTPAPFDSASTSSAQASVHRIFLIQAVIATFLSLPALMRRSYMALIAGLYRMADIAPIYNAERTAPRPPKMLRLPRSVPLSRLNGASPTSAAISLRLSVPSSDSSAVKVRATTGPTPLKPHSKSSLAFHAELWRISLSSPLSVSLSRASSHSIVPSSPFARSCR